MDSYGDMVLRMWFSLLMNDMGPVPREEFLSFDRRFIGLVGTLKKIGASLQAIGVIVPMIFMGKSDGVSAWDF